MIEIFFHFVTVSIFTESGSFNVDNVRVCKILVRISFFPFALVSFADVCQCLFIFI